MSPTLLAFLINSLLSGQETILLQPRSRPGEGPAEKVVERSKDGVPDRAISEVSQPSLTVYLPPPDKANGMAVVICPGGGYERLAIDKEGHEVARWLNTLGVAGIVLKYRLPGKGADAGARSLKQVLEAKRVAVEDANEAMKVVKASAARWKLDRNAIGLMGFSAGGHLASLVGMTAPAAVRPDFLVLVYPGIPPVLEVNASTPPTFLVHAADDPSVPAGDTSIRFFLELRKVNVPAELHVYASGGHGFGLRRKEDTISTWPAALAAWLQRPRR